MNNNNNQAYLIAINGFLILALSCMLNACKTGQVTKSSTPYSLSIAQNILIDDSASNKGGPCEPSIAINPTNPDQVVAGAILDRVYWSEDGGKTWSKDQLRSPVHGVYGDPVLVADFQGNFFYAHLSDPSGKGWDDPTFLDRIVVQRSTDGGQSWTDGTSTEIRHPKDQDKHWIGIDPNSNKLCMAWTEFDKYDSRDPKDKSRILFSSSSNQGTTWTPPIAINDLEGDCLDDDFTTEGAVPAVGLNGEIYVAWGFAESIYFDKSLDGGKTWGNDKIVSKQPLGWNHDIPGIFRANGMPVTAVDISDGPQKGTVYVNWADQRNGTEDTDIFLAKSSDGGTTWSKPIRVNDDQTKTHQFFPWMSVDPVTGGIFIVFYDRRAYADTQTDVYLAYSFDGGASFTNMKISETPFTPNPYVFFGDYNNISAYNGMVRPIWTRCDKAALSVWTALIDFDIEAKN